MIQIRSRLVLHQFARARKLVPGTYRQAIVAAIDPIADRRTEFHRYGAFQLNGQIGDAKPRIELKRAGDCPRRAGVQASGAGAAAILFRRVRLEFHGGDDLGEENPVAKPAADEIGVFADETEASALSEVAFEQWPRIHIPKGARPGGPEPVHRFSQQIQAFAEDFVVVLKASVAGDNADGLLPDAGGGWRVARRLRGAFDD